MRIPGEADQRSGLMPIIPGDGDQIPGDADHLFRGDRDQWIAIVGRVITMPGRVIAMPRRLCDDLPPGPGRETSFPLRVCRARSTAK